MASGMSWGIFVGVTDPFWDKGVGTISEILKVLFTEY